MITYAVTRNGYVEHPDYHQLKDKAGNFRCCYYCRMTALKKPMIACDYCPLYWHLDCLTPPLAIPPNPARKWRCPNHFEHFMVCLYIIYYIIYDNYLKYMY